MTKIIGFSGLAGSGKDTAADIIENISNEKIYRCSIAGPLKEMVRAAYDLTEDQVYTSKKDVLDEYWRCTPRDLLIEIGTLMRDRDSDHWIKLLERLMKKAIESHDMIIITDVRYDNEAEFIRRMGGQIVGIKRKDWERKNDHASENGLTKYDIEIENEGVMEKYVEEIKRLMIHISL